MFLATKIFLERAPEISQRSADRARRSRNGKGEHIKMPAKYKSALKAIAFGRTNEYFENGKNTVSN